MTNKTSDKTFNQRSDAVTDNVLDKSGNVSVNASAIENIKPALGHMDSSNSAAIQVPPASPKASLIKEWIAAYFSSKLATFGFILALLLALLAIFAPWITPQNPYDLLQLDILDSRLPPGSENGMATFTYWLGTDGQGRDLYSAILYGLRISLLVGLGSAIIAGTIGTIVGVASAFFGGRVDAFIMRIVDLMLSFPSILVAMMILAFLGKGISNVILTLVILEWAYYARTARGQALAERQKEYVEAAINLDIPKWRLMLIHILPNCLPPLMVIAMLQVARAITLEATMSFLGLGVPVTEPSLGLLISNGYQYMLSGQYWISVFPGLALLFTIFSLNLVSDQLRAVFNPRGYK